MNDYEGVAITHRIIAAGWGIFLMTQLYDLFSTVHRSPAVWVFIFTICVLALVGHIVLSIGASNANLGLVDGALL